MKNFEYAQPRSEAEAIALLAEPSIQSVVLAGGTDLMGLIKSGVSQPDRVVNICDIAAWQRMHTDAEGNLWIGAAVCLGDVLNHRDAAHLTAVHQAIQGISSIQLQSQGTLVGELLRRPRCWYFRDGHGLLADNGRRVVAGDNRYHAILGNRGPAKFVSASRIAPPLIALGARVRVVGPQADSESFIDLHDLYHNPVAADQLEHTLASGQLLTHVIIPSNSGRLSATYEVRHGEGPDQPLAAAAVSLQVVLGQVRQAAIVLGQVAPTPWIAREAAQALVGHEINPQTAAIAGLEAVAGAMPLSHNEYKIQLTQVAVKRALLRAAGLDTGGLDRPITPESKALPASEIHLV